MRLVLLKLLLTPLVVFACLVRDFPFQDGVTLREKLRELWSAR